ncbi:sulfate ABC transporter substrate-binding protein [Cyanobium sp. ATX 6F1]|uniref:sulfate ABC transporter substrate-binding protein n=1 Tax=Cyanobium sp. ATX 6F1 TaxID=2823702 RepID=UPI0020CC71E7|nr:sulfate ABC transporter substrate-binding protein [Cyanobium sp. ATX 6F1]
MVQSFSVLGRRAALGLGVAVIAGLPLAASSSFSLFGAPAQAQQKKELLLVSYAVTKSAYDRIIPLFQADYRKQTGQIVSVKTSYGSSGSQTRAVIDGLEADVVGLALAGDILKIEEAGLIKPGWEKENPNNSIITNSLVVFFTRAGNPKKITSWKDLDNKNVDVVTANPKTSGGARWNFLGLWGSITQTGGSETQARNFVTTVYKNVEVLPKDAREATDIFVKRKQGDVLLNYENEAILAKKTGEWTVPYKIPSPNILIEGPIAVVDKNVDKKGTRKVAEAFTRFLYTPAAQKVFSENGFRPVTAQGKAAAKGRFQSVPTYTASEFGGWRAINAKIFGKRGLWDSIFARSR